MTCAIYLSNRSPLITIWGKTPQEAWSGIKTSILYLTTRVRNLSMSVMI